MTIFRQCLALLYFKASGAIKIIFDFRETKQGNILTIHIGLLPGYRELQIFKNALTWFNEHTHRVSYFGPLSGLCLDYIEDLIGIPLLPGYEALPKF